MIKEIVWTTGAAEDYLGACEHATSEIEFTLALDTGLKLLRLFPNHGSQIEYSNRLRRILIGKKREFGLYYSVIGNRLIVSALVNLRQNPSQIMDILRSRGVG